MTDSKLSPAQLVRSLPTKTPAEVVLAAKKVGIKIDTTYVSKTRGLDKARAARWGTKPKGAEKKTNAAPAKRGRKATSAPPAAAGAGSASTQRAARKAPRAAATGARKTPSKADFIRSMPNAAPAAVAQAAKKAGIQTNESYVKWLRWSDARTSGPKAKKAPRPAARPAPRGKARTAAQSPKAARATTHLVPVASPTASRGSERAFVDSTFEIGLTRAGELLASLRQQLKGMSL